MLIEAPAAAFVQSLTKKKVSTSLLTELATAKNVTDLYAQEEMAENLKWSSLIGQ